MEDRFETDVDDLWSALTRPERLARWIAVVEGDVRRDATVHARFTSTWEGAVRIDVCDAPTRLLVTLEPDTEDETVIEANLLPGDGSTLLVIEERGLPRQDLAAHGAGWQVHVEDLATHLAGADPEPWRDRWLALRPAYQALDERTA
jgi:uncharacterized protein YndB with AHSA1/START domain